MTSEVTAFFKKNLELIKTLASRGIDSSSFLRCTSSECRFWQSSWVKTKCFKPVRTNCFANCFFVSLSVINAHSDITRKLSLSNVVEIFASKKERKPEFFSHLLSFMTLRLPLIFTSFYIWWLLCFTLTQDFRRWN